MGLFGLFEGQKQEESNKSNDEEDDGEDEEDDGEDEEDEDGSYKIVFFYGNDSTEEICDLSKREAEDVFKKIKEGIANNESFFEIVEDGSYLPCLYSLRRANRINLAFD